MFRLFNAVVSSFVRESSSDAIVRRAALAAVEPLEARQFLSASHHSSHEPSPGVGPAVHASPKAGESHSSMPLAIWNASATFDGQKGHRNFIVSILTDSNGQVTARVGGDGLGMKDVTGSGTHDGSMYHVTFTTSKGSAEVSGVLGDDGKLTGTVTVKREGKTFTGTFSATAVPLPKPKPPPTPKPEKPKTKENDNNKGNDKKDGDSKNKTVHFTVLTKLAGLLMPAGADGSVAMAVQLAVTSDGIPMAVITCNAFPVKTFVLMGTKTGDTYSLSGKGEHGSASMTLTLHGDTAEGTISRTDDGKTVSGNFSLTKSA